jgi:hypothetical protein
MPYIYLTFLHSNARVFPCNALSFDTRMAMQIAPKYREVFHFYTSLRILLESREALSRPKVDERKASMLKEADMNSRSLNAAIFHSVVQNVRTHLYGYSR